MSEPSIPIKKKELAEKLGRPRGFVLAMCRAGYRMQYPPHMTTVEHALKALEGKDFIPAHYLSKSWKRLPKILADRGHQVA